MRYEEWNDYDERDNDDGESIAEGIMAGELK